MCRYSQGPARRVPYTLTIHVDHNVCTRRPQFTSFVGAQIQVVHRCKGLLDFDGSVIQRPTAKPMMMTTRSRRTAALAASSLAAP